MKKTISLAMFGAMVLVFASCSNDEVVSQPKSNRAIGFSTFVDNSTRGEDLTTDNIASFSVWGGYKSVVDAGKFTSLYDNVLVQKEGTDWKHDSSKLQYWTLGDAYWFAAVSGSSYVFTPDFTVWSTKGNGSLKFYQQDNGEITGAKGQVDLCYAWKNYLAVTDAEATAKVGFTFQHVLSRVTFSFINNMPNTSDKLVIKDVSFDSTLDGSDATLNFYSADASWDGKPFWTGGTPKSSNSLPTTISGDKVEINYGVTTAPLYIIPYNAALNAFSVAFTIEYYQNDVLEKTFVRNVNLPAVNYEMGKSYNLVANINWSNIDPSGELKPIQFAVETINGWTDNGSTTVWEAKTY